VNKGWLLYAESLPILSRTEQFTVYETEFFRAEFGIPSVYVTVSIIYGPNCTNVRAVAVPRVIRTPVGACSSAAAERARAARMPEARNNRNTRSSGAERARAAKMAGQEYPI
jgi:hypothetical protein